MIIALASWVHYTWAFTLFSEPVQTVGLGLSLKLMPSNILAGCMYLVAGFLATIAIVGRYKEPSSGVKLLIPQQFLLFVSAISAIVCIANGQYADGIIRSWKFILDDQCWMIYLCILHAVATFTGFVMVRKVVLYIE